jgi:anti-sigma B factor antagonist
MTLTLAQRVEGDVAVVAPSGRLTLGEGDQKLLEVVRSLVSAGRRQIVLDLERTSYVDSAGVGALVSAYTTVTSAGGRLALAALPKRVADLLSVTHLISVFPVYSTVDEAVRALQS